MSFAQLQRVIKHILNIRRTHDLIVLIYVHNQNSLGNEPVMWKDVTNSVDIIWHKDVAMFSGNVSGRFWLIFLEKDSPAGSIADIIPVANRIYSKITKTRYRAGISAKITVRKY